MPRGTRKTDPGSASSGALRTLVGAGPSLVGVVGALRARDVSRPSEADLSRTSQDASEQSEAPTGKASADKG